MITTKGILMLNLDNLLLNFIELNYLDTDKKTIYESFSLLENFGIKFYEDKYIELIISEKTHKEDQLDTLMYYLRLDLNDILRAHYIYLQTDMYIKLDEINEVVSFLYIIQNLEDYDLIAYRLYAQDTPENIITDLITYYTVLPKHRVMEIIFSADSRIIRATQLLIEDKIKTSSSVEEKQLLNLKAFLAFTDNADCLGKKLIYSNLKTILVKDLELILELDISDYIDSKITADKAQVILDILSVLLVCKDSYETPLLSLKKNYALFFNKEEYMLSIEPMLIKLLNDYNNFKEHFQK